MTVTIKAHHVSITDSIKEYVETKLGRLDKFFSHITSISVDLDVTKAASSDERHSVSVNVWVPNNVFRAKKVSSDMYASVDYVFDKLEKQLKKHKGKIRDRNRHGEQRNIIRELDQQFAEQLLSEESADMAHKESDHYVPKPMFAEDAKVIMEERDVTFLMFHNAETDLVNVIYQVTEDEIHLLEPRSTK